MVGKSNRTLYTKPLAENIRVSPDVNKLKFNYSLDAYTVGERCDYCYGWMRWLQKTAQ